MVSMTSVLVATVANFILSALWYMPLFGKAWAKEMGYSTEPSDADKSGMVKGMIFTAVGGFLTAYVLAHNNMAWSFVPEMANASQFSKAMPAAIFTWLGFFLPGDLSSMVWEKKSVKLFLINTGFHLVAMLLMAFILIYMS